MKNHATCVSLCGKKKDTSVFRRETLLLHVLYMRRRVYRTVLLTSRLHVDSGEEHIRVVCVYITRRARKSHSVVFPRARKTKVVATAARMCTHTTLGHTRVFCEHT